MKDPRSLTVLYASIFLAFAFTLVDSETTLVASETAEDTTAAPVLNHRELLEAQSFWDNRDFGWFENNIPFLDTPDAEINTTYYYRWSAST